MNEALAAGWGDWDDPELVHLRPRTKLADILRLDRKLLVAQAHGTIRKGSRSFAVASRLFDKAARERVWLLYAWCRACDDIIDGQDHGYATADAPRDPVKRVAAIRMLTARVLEGDPTGLPAFDAFGMVASETGLTAAMAEDVIAGFELDASGWRPGTETDLLRYCYHVAGAVGVMMAVVMGVPPRKAETLDRAADLGIAFQLANIARDIAEDEAAGRCYLPADWLAQAGIAPGTVMAPGNREALVGLVGRLTTLEARYEASSRPGAARLALRRRWAVLTATGIYGDIARRVERAGAQAWDQRTRVPALAKLAFVLRGLVQAATLRGGTADDAMLLTRSDFVPIRGDL